MWGLELKARNWREGKKFQDSKQKCHGARSFHSLGKSCVVGVDVKSPLEHISFASYFEKSYLFELILALDPLMG